MTIIWDKPANYSIYYNISGSLTNGKRMFNIRYYSGKTTNNTQLFKGFTLVQLLNDDYGVIVDKYKTIQEAKKMAQSLLNEFSEEIWKKPKT